MQFHFDHQPEIASDNQDDQHQRDLRQIPTFRKQVAVSSHVSVTQEVFNLLERPQSIWWEFTKIYSVADERWGE